VATTAGGVLTPRHAFLVGTNFSGSTVFGQALGAHSSMAYLGEVDRAARFEETMWQDEPDPGCHYCELHGERCPVWTPERLEAVRGLPRGKLMSYFEGELGCPVLVDGSKHPNWLRSVLADEPVDRDRVVAFVTARSPFAFCDSFRFRTGCPTWQAANIWRDVYYDAVRQVNRSRIPSMVVRYEDFALDPAPVLRSACTLLGADYEEGMPYFQGRPSHDIGGNFNVLAAPEKAAEEFSADAFRERVAQSWTAKRQQSEVYWGKPFGGWVDDKWQRNTTEDDIEFVLQTPGLADVANLLGYELSKDVLAWERRRAAAG
jgi:hypothetical protein